MLISTIGGRRTAGRIVEVEAYVGPQDPASHGAARFGRTRRNAPMFGAPATAYVYRIYGVHRCFNVVTGRPGFPSAVLIRALEPLEGVEVMVERRGRSRDLCNGPGRLAAALGIDETWNGHELSEPPLWIAPERSPGEIRVGASGRIGVSRAADWPLRFYEQGNPHVSRGRGPRGRRTPEFRAAIAALQDNQNESPHE